MTDRKSAANLGLDTPTIIKQSESGPPGITDNVDAVAFGNHLQKEEMGN